MSEQPTNPEGRLAARPSPVRMLLPAVAILVIAGIAAVLLIPGTPKPTLPAGAVQVPAGSSGYYGTLALPSKPAPPIRLENYMGQPVTLSQYRGRAVLVTFLYANCPDVCPLIASNLRVALNQLGPRAKSVQVIAVSVDPRGDTPAAVGHFLAAHEMVGRMQYLIGSAPQLARTWAAWDVGSTRDVGQPNLVSHSALVYGITASGRLTTIYPATFEPGEIVHDVPLLASR